MRLTYIRRTILSSFLLLLFVTHLQAQDDFFSGNFKADDQIPTPQQYLGFEPGSQPVHHLQVVAYFKKLAALSPRAVYHESGQTHEGRLLGYLLISSQENIANIEQIKTQHSALADPRSAQKVDINKMPAVAWMMYSIHGDELSGTDASVVLAYHLVAGQDETTQQLLNNLVIGIDPMENPDGRERRLAQLQQWQRALPNSDYQDIDHYGIWPYGRGNHYLFDLNRDWFILAHPESRARVKALNEWNPQLVVDAHEMGGNDTYLFNPPREPINFNIYKSVRKWWQVYAQDQAKAFDQFGWSYYTREWADDLYPGYGSDYSTYSGSIGILYEQAGTDGSLVKKPADKLSTFRDAVHRQYTSSLANLKTTADNRLAVLKDFQAARISATKNKGAFFIAADKNPSRVKRLLERLLLAGIEVHKSSQSFTINDAESWLPGKKSKQLIAAGSYIIPLAQPLGTLAKAILEFDPRMKTTVLQKEYEELLKGKGTHLYEILGWSMLLAYNVPAYYSASSYPADAQLITSVESNKSALHNARDAVVFLCKYDDDQAIKGLLDMYKKDLKIRAALEPFECEGIKYDRGTLLLRVNENGEDLPLQLKEIAENNAVDIYGVQSMRILSGPDLGGQRFQLLQEPRIAILTGPDISGYDVGTHWYMLDYELNTRFTFLNHDFFDDYDLSKYNVLIFPDTWGGIKTYNNLLGKEGIAKVKDWLNDGGTLIGVDGGAAFLADSTSKLSQVKLRRQALDELDVYARALTNERLILQKVDSLLIWQGRGKNIKKEEPPKMEKAELQALKELDAQQILFQPRGAIMNVVLDRENWLNFGMADNVPAMIYTPYAFLSKKPVQTAGRFAGQDALRLSGLLWPQAAERWAETAFATREASGKGQIILFAGQPNFRSYFYGTSRMLINAIVLGPGMGTQSTVDF